MINRRLLSLAGSVWGPIALGTLMAYVVMGSWILQAIVVARGLNDLVAGDFPGLVRCLLIAMLVILVRGVLMVVRQMLTVSLGMRTRRHLRTLLTRRVAELGPAHMSTQRAGVIRSTLIEGVDGLDPYYSDYVPQLLVTATVPIALLIWMGCYSPWSAVAVAVCILVAVVVPQRFDNKLIVAGRERWEAYSSLSADYLESMQQMETLRSLGAAGRRHAGLESRTWELYRTTMQSLKISLVSTGLIALGTQAGVALAVVLAVRDPQSASHLFLVLLLAMECFRPVQELAKAWHAGYLGVTAADGLDAILSPTPPVPDEGTRSNEWSVGTPPGIEIRDASVTYPGAGTPALTGLNLRIPAGQAVALTGPSGCGKTTVQRLITRSLDPSSGSVSLDGVDLRTLRLAEMPGIVTVVSQDAFLFTGSVTSNIALGVPPESIKKEDVLQAARAAGLPSELLDVELSDNGKQLSGGQRQRVAVARALYRQTPVIVFDEATSHVDSATAAHISETIGRLKGDRTVIVITHGSAELAVSDQVIDLSKERTQHHA